MTRMEKLEAVAEAARPYAYHGADNNRLLKALDALDAAGHALEQGWQPIETAPRDGTPVLLIARYPDGVTWSDQYHSWWHDTARKSRVVTQDGHWARWPHPFPPSHWRPLPAPPSGEATP